MRKPRCEVIDPAEVNVVHVCARTVRRCFLFGYDQLTGTNFDHRKQWIEELLEHFAAHFGIDLLTFAVLSNHFHLILRNRPEVVAQWDDTEVARRWLMICPHRKDEQGKPQTPSEAELDTIRRCPVKLEQVRQRLADVSWWMRLLCQRIATRSNREDEASGRFFEERYRAIRLLDEASLLACSAYVDLNPIRAAICETIESSDHTSAQLRIESMRKENSAGKQAGSCQKEPDDSNRSRSVAMLSPLPIDERLDRIGPCASESSHRCSDKGYLPMSVLDYIELLDWTARQSRSDKRWRTAADVPPVVMRLGLSAQAWCELVDRFGCLFHHVAGCPETIDRLRSHRRGARFRVHQRVRELMPTFE
jgi:hypothetical protein